MTYSNASPLMVHGKNQQGLRWLRLNVSGLVVVQEVVQDNLVAPQMVAAAGAVVLCGTATALCGPIGFVGLVVPHLCRMIAGVDYRLVLPLSALAGASMLGLSDVLGRVIARPNELDVGIVTAFVGAPFFIWTVRNHRMRGL